MDILDPWDFVKEFKINFSKNKCFILGPLSKGKRVEFAFNLLNGYIIRGKNFEMEVNLENGIIRNVVEDKKLSYGKCIILALQILCRFQIKKCYIENFTKYPTEYINYGFYPVNSAGKDLTIDLDNLLKKLYKIGWEEFGENEELRTILYMDKNYATIASPYHYICQDRESIIKWISKLKEDTNGYKELMKIVEILSDCLIYNPYILCQK